MRDAAGDDPQTALLVAGVRRGDKCLELPAITDAIGYVASAKEVWITTPKEQSIAIVEASEPTALTLKTTIKLDGEPELFAVDDARGLVFDVAHDFVVVACTDHIQVLDAGHDGAALGKLETGAGVDAIDLVDGKVYVAAGKAAKLTIAKLDEKGQLAVLATVATSEGVRNAVADSNGNVYAADARAARFLVFGAPKTRK